MTDTQPAGGETVVAPSNGPAAPVTPVQTDNVGGSEVDKVKQELQAQMRANQLAKEELKKLQDEKEARDKADSDRKAKELEDNQEYKTLLEQERTKREELERDAEKRETEAELAKAKTDVLKDFNEDVREQAEELGIDLTNADETAVSAFKDKLEKIQSRLTGSEKVTPNNPKGPGPSTQPSGDDLKLALQDEHSFHDLVTKHYPGIAAMTSPPREK